MLKADTLEMVKANAEKERCDRLVAHMAG